VFRVRNASTSPKRTGSLGQTSAVEIESQLKRGVRSRRTHRVSGWADNGLAPFLFSFKYTPSSCFRSNEPSVGRDENVTTEQQSGKRGEGDPTAGSTAASGSRPFILARSPGSRGHRDRHLVPAPPGIGGQAQGAPGEFEALRRGHPTPGRAPAAGQRLNGVKAGVRGGGPVSYSEREGRAGLRS
jgi:hypothetical protein